jgi:hypothetical protein
MLLDSLQKLPRLGTPPPLSQSGWNDELKYSPFGGLHLSVLLVDVLLLPDVAHLLESQQQRGEEPCALSVENFNRRDVFGSESGFYTVAKLHEGEKWYRRDISRCAGSQLSTSGACGSGACGSSSEPPIERGSTTKKERKPTGYIYGPLTVDAKLRDICEEASQKEASRVYFAIDFEGTAERPCEVAVVAFTMEGGEQGFYHSFIDFGGGDGAHKDQGANMKQMIALLRSQRPRL